MNASALKDRIRIMMPVETRKPSGQIEKTWAVPIAVYARVEHLGARVYTAALAEQTGCAIRATIRRRPMVVSGWRAEVDGATYKINSVTPDRHPGYLVLMLQTDDGNG